MNPGADLTLDELKAWNLNLVHTIREEKINSGFTFNGHVYDSDERSRSNISGACTLALVLLGQQQDFPEGFSWRDADNVDVPMAAADVIALAVATGTFVTTCYGVSWYHKTNITAMTDIATLQDYDLTVGWPS